MANYLLSECSITDSTAHTLLEITSPSESFVDNNNQSVINQIRGARTVVTTGEVRRLQPKTISLPQFYRLRINRKESEGSS